MKKRKVNQRLIQMTFIILISVSFFMIAFQQIRTIEEKRSFETLEDAASQMRTNVEHYINQKEKSLLLIAEILQKYDSQDVDIAQILEQNAKEENGMEELGLLRTDGSFIQAGKKNFNLLLNFEEEKEKIPYISGVQKGEDGLDYLYQAVPVEKDGDLIGILYGFLEQKQLEEVCSISGFQGEAESYIVDRESGDFLVDTWHDTLGNAYDDSMERKKKTGYPQNAFEDDVRAGRDGNVVFESKQAGEYFYSWYAALEKPKWMVTVTVRESIVFASSKDVQLIMLLLIAAELSVFAAYFVRLLWEAHQQNESREQRLEQTLFVMEVQQTFLDINKSREMIFAALKKVHNLLEADTAFMVSIKGEKVQDAFLCPDLPGKPNDFQLGAKLYQILPHYADKLQAGHLVDCGCGTGGKRLLLVPVMDSERELVGILGGYDVRRKWKTMEALESVAQNFVIALDNVNVYQRIRRMGIIDVLTGLGNRNSYEQVLMQYQNSPEYNLCCVYIDANGLHDINNHLGHEAGDRMLEYLGKQIRMIFIKDNAYRVGGDEFVIFCQDCQETELKECIQRLHEKMKEAGYAISVGTAWYERHLQVDEWIQLAEERMYEEKREYYRNRGGEEKVREMNYELEKILEEKKYSDTFLNIISSYFLGVYAVNVLTDETRVIFKPPYFSEELEKTGYRFQPAMRMYIYKYVKAEDRERFLSFMDYKALDRALCREITPELRYQKINGDNLILRIYKVADYSEKKKEMFWLFEKL